MPADDGGCFGDGVNGCGDGWECGGVGCGDGGECGVSIVVMAVVMAGNVGVVAVVAVVMVVMAVVTAGNVGVVLW